MNLQLVKSSHSDQEVYSSSQRQPDQIKQKIRQSIYEALQIAKELLPDACLSEIRDRLLCIQNYCKSVEKTFIFVEEAITCDQYGLGGNCQDVAILFRGPSEDASVAICVTHKGSLLHRNDSPWMVYRDMGDIRLMQRRH